MFLVCSLSNSISPVVPPKKIGGAHFYFGPNLTKNTELYPIFYKRIEKKKTKKKIA